MENKPKYIIQAVNLRLIIDKEYDGNANKFAKALGFRSSTWIDAYLKGRAEVRNRGKFYQALIAKGYDVDLIKTGRFPDEPTARMVKDKAMDYITSDAYDNDELRAMLDAIVDKLARKRT